MSHETQISEIPVTQSEDDRRGTKLERTYHRRRAVAIGASAAAVLTVVGGITAISEANKPPKLSGQTLQIEPGDTLWGMAKDAPGMDPRDFVDDMLAVNPGVNPGDLTPGETLSVPVDVAQYMDQGKAK